MPEPFLTYRPAHDRMPTWPAFVRWKAWRHPFVGWNEALWRVADGR